MADQAWPRSVHALGAALLHLALERAWVSRDLDSRTLTLTSRGRRDLRVRVGLDLPPS
ncbi:hypothetical protein [Luteitalea pratensis]|uniref:hypothetical protein n=1 Tax=Luteitalea pratensis TaxID=1855912 RepID=UPI0012FFA83A|nr:hypothetical protein [Luteitalea pratensis]